MLLRKIRLNADYCYDPIEQSIVTVDTSDTVFDDFTEMIQNQLGYAKFTYDKALSNGIDLSQYVYIPWLNS